MSFRSYDLLKLTQDFGEPLTLRTFATGTYQPSSGTVTGQNATNISFIGYMYNYTNLNPNEVVRGTRKCIIPALGLGVIPEPDDEILGNADKVKVKAVSTVFSNGVAVCYMCEVGE